MERRTGDGRRPLTAGLLGRANELASLQALVDGLAEGRGGAVLIEGPPGIGKTRLMEAVLDLAVSAGVTTAFASSDPLGSRRPFHLILGAFASLADRDDETVDDLAQFLDTMADGVEPLGLVAPGSARVQAMEFLIAELEGRARSPLLLAVEDLHWADEASLSTLRTAIRLTRELPLLIVASARPAPRRDADAAVRAALIEAGEVIRPEELDDHGIAELLAALLDARPGAALAAMAARTGGIPLLVTELARALDAEGMLVDDGTEVDLRAGEVDVPLLDAVARRIRAVPDEVMVILRTASVLGLDFSVRELAALMGRPAASLVEPVASALATGLLADDGDRLRFEHALLREAVYADLAVPLRTALHHDAARVLADFDASAVTIATQAALGAAPGDAQAVGWLREAADNIMSLDPESALAMLDDAVILGASDVSVQNAIQRARVESLMGVGRLDEAARVAEHLLDGLEAAADRCELRTRLAGILVLLNRPADAIIQLDLSADEAPKPSDRALAQAYGSLARLATADLLGAASQARDAAELAETCGEPRARTLAASVLGRLPCFGHGYTDGLLTALTAVEAADADPTGQSHGFLPWFWVGVIALDLDDSERVDIALREGRRRVDADRAAWAHPLYCGLAASWHHRRGDLDDARAEAETGVSMAQDTGSRQAQMWSECILALGAHLQGEPDERDKWVRAAEESFARGNSQLGIDYLALVQSLALESADACEHLGAAWDLFEAISNRNCQPLLAVPLARVAVAHDPSRGNDVAAALHHAAVRTGLPSLAAIELHVGGLIMEDVERLVRAARLFEACGRRLDQSGALADAARVAARRDRALAANLRTDALSGFAACGAAGSALELQRDVAELGLAPAPTRRPLVGWESLTRTELAVVTLLGEGLTNSEIAHRRNVSRRTVESHLQRVYTKLGYSSRVRLAIAAAERPGRADRT